MAADPSSSLTPSATPADVTALLRSEIPLTRAMGFSITGWDGASVTLAAPLALNQNHADTAFGGSISSMGILAGYSVLYMLLLERKFSTRILIQKSETDFLRPIDSDMVATARSPNPAPLAEFLDTLTRKRRSRLSVESQIFSGPTLAATHKGLYIALIY